MVQGLNEAVTVRDTSRWIKDLVSKLTKRLANANILMTTSPPANLLKAVREHELLFEEALNRTNAAKENLPSGKKVRTFIIDIDRITNALEAQWDLVASQIHKSFRKSDGLPTPPFGTG